MALGRTVAELEATTSAKEYQQWIEYYYQEPWGAERDNLHSAMLAAIMANAHRGKNRKAFNVEDFFYKTQEASSKDTSWNTIKTMRRMAKKAKANG